MVPLSPEELADVVRQLESAELTAEPVQAVTLSTLDEVWDAMVAEDSSFVAGEVVVHNSNICRLLHGKTFSVADALQRFERVESLERPEDVKQELPWVRERLDADTGRALLYVNRGGQETRLAEVLRSAASTRDDVGEFRALASDRQLADAGVGFPPFHGLCRTTTLAVT
nr:hypothetical protein [Myxococcus sp. AB036A]